MTAYAFVLVVLVVLALLAVIAVLARELREARIDARAMHERTFNALVAETPREYLDAQKVDVYADLDPTTRAFLEAETRGPRRPAEDEPPRVPIGRA